MIKLIQLLGIKKRLPRGGVFTLDMVIVLTAFLLSYLLRFNFDFQEPKLAKIPYVLPFYVLARALMFHTFKTYSRVIHHVSTEDVINIFLAISSGSVIFGAANGLAYIIDEKYIIPFSVIIIDLIVSMFLLSSFRIMVKVLYLESINQKKESRKVVVVGDSQQAVITKKALDRDEKINYKVVAFVILERAFKNHRIEGVKVFHKLSRLNEVLEEFDPNVLILSGEDLKTKEKDALVETCLHANVDVLNVPPMSNWINGELSFNQFKKIRIEDLLGRDPINLDKAKIENQIHGKNVLVTGAAGSIGSGLVRQILKFQPKKIFLLDQAESPIYELEIELREKHKSTDFEVVIADVRNNKRIERVFEAFKPNIVFHAAAYKHVPLMENNPSEAILTNVLGTKNVVDWAVKYKAEKFVLISTDKAVNPTNVMGASKRLAEIYVQSLQAVLDQDSTKIITTRFGNVLGSNGSVIPLFRKQILSGGPVTVTHPEVTRYFMTIPEACQLVLEAGAMGNGGEIFLFDMGESVKIVDLAKKMIKLSGLELGKDIQLTFTGLRPGEKLYEELLTIDENNLPTHHGKIMIGKVREYNFDNINLELNELVELFASQDNLKIVAKMKEIVPEYRSNNSEFEKLDQSKEKLV